MKFSQKILSKYKLYQVFSKAFIKSWNWDRALWALALRPLQDIERIVIVGRYFETERRFRAVCREKREIVSFQ